MNMESTIKELNCNYSLKNIYLNEFRKNIGENILEGYQLKMDYSHEDSYENEFYHYIILILFYGYFVYGFLSLLIS